jgi:hypothetical protein
MRILLNDALLIRPQQGIHCAELSKNLAARDAREAKLKKRLVYFMIGNKFNAKVHCRPSS